MITCDLSHYDNPNNPNSGLGNQLFKIAGTIGIAIKLGYEYGFNKQFSFFKNKLPEVISEDRIEVKIPWGQFNIKIPDNVIFDTYSYLQSEKYFAHCKELIRYYFEFKPISNFTIPGNSIAIHYRAGDYGTEHHPRMDKKYYETAIQLMPYEKVFVFSDDIKEAKNIIGSDAEYIETGDYAKDLYLMEQCTHFIISNSTFPWWAVWLSNKNGKVVAPFHWFGPAKGISPRDIYCYDWILI